MVSPAIDWHETKTIGHSGRTRPDSLAQAPSARDVSHGCLRLTSNSVARKGARTGVVFCSGSTLPVKTAFQPWAKALAEVDRPICWAPQTVHVTVNATAQPVHLLLRSSVALSVANCTDTLKHALCQGFLRQFTSRRTPETMIFANCHMPACAQQIQIGSFFRGGWVYRFCSGR